MMNLNQQYQTPYVANMASQPQTHSPPQLQLQPQMQPAIQRQSQIPVQSPMAIPANFNGVAGYLVPMPSLSLYSHLQYGMPQMAIQQSLMQPQATVTMAQLLNSGLFSPKSQTNPNPNLTPNFNANLRLTIPNVLNSDSNSLSSASSISPSPPSNFQKNKYISKTTFEPAYPSRARLNIFVDKKVTKALLSNISEPFPSAENLYYFIDISTAMQINDKEMAVFDFGDFKLVLANYDLHCKRTGDALYAVILENRKHRKKENKWLWCLAKFGTEAEVLNEFGIERKDLPKSSRAMAGLKKELNLEREDFMKLNMDLVMRTDWCNVQRVKRKPTDDLQIVLKLGKRNWERKCRESWNQWPAIPIIVNENKKNENVLNLKNKHWVEWVKLICVKEGLFVGVSCRFDLEREEWSIKSICLDKGDVSNKHRLCALKDLRYLELLEKNEKMGFNTVFTEVLIFDK